MEGTISLEGLDKAAVLAGLYNASRPLGMGFLQYDRVPMTTEEAQAILKQGHTYFDYLKGRVMKIDLGGDELDPRLYDRDNGAGAAAKAIAALQRGGVDAPEIQQAHQEGKKYAAARTREMIGTPTTSKKVGNIMEIHLGLDDAADQLGPAVDKALEK